MASNADTADGEQIVANLNSKIESLETVIEEMQAKVYQNTLESLDT